MTDNVIKIKIFRGEDAVEIEGDSDLVWNQFVEKGRMDKLFQGGFVNSQKSLKSEEIEEGTDFNGHLIGNAVKNGSTVDKTESSALRDSLASYSEETIDTKLINDSIFAILKYRLNSREVFWLLVACYLLSEFGKEEFSREDILTLYDETGRSTLSRKKNLTNNLRTMSDQYNWVEGSNSRYILTDDGISRAERLIAREEESSLDNNIIN